MIERIRRLFWPKKVRYPRLERPKYVGRHPNRLALVLGSGPTLMSHSDAIHEFIYQRFAQVFAANRAFASVPVVDYIGFTNRHRLQAYGAETVGTGLPLLIGSSIPDWIIRRIGLRCWERLPYVADDDAPFSVRDGIIQSGCGGVGPLLIATAAIMGCTEIWVAGMDGYPKGVPEHAYVEPDHNASGVMRHQEQTKRALVGMRAWFKEIGVSGPHFLTPSVYGEERNV